MGNSNHNILAQHQVTICTSRLEYPMRASRIGDFRKLVNSYAGSANDLFHNHKSEKTYHYRYPVVQYKLLDGKATLVGLTEPGAAALQSLMAHKGFRERCMEWLGEQFAVTEEFTDTLFLGSDLSNRYRLRQYLALNEDNFKTWLATPGLAGRTALLERCLTAHVLKLASAVRWKLPPGSLQVEILDFQSYTTRLHHVPFLAFDLLFQTNITLPENAGLGKAVSHGYGTLFTDQ